MAGRIIHEIGQEAKKNLKDPILLVCSSEKSGYFCKDQELDEALGLFNYDAVHNNELLSYTIRWTGISDR